MNEISLFYYHCNDPECFLSLQHRDFSNRYTHRDTLQCTLSKSLERSETLSKAFPCAFPVLLWSFPTSVSSVKSSETARKICVITAKRKLQLHKSISCIVAVSFLCYKRALEWWWKITFCICFQFRLNKSVDKKDEYEVHFNLFINSVLWFCFRYFGIAMCFSRWIVSWRREKR